ncbi:MAG TPA: hypothetical protein VGS58_08050, partial [Candidatus Sulfopaludibacter sp.]|nr:hypothetical protein [Candidatus Sulfopaludibacter sp.]
MRRLAVLLCLCAASLWAQKSILGTLADFHSRTLEFELRADGGATLRFKVSPQTQVMRIPPGERD